MCSPSGESIVSRRHLAHVGDRPVCRYGWNSLSSIHTCIPDGHLNRVTCARRIDTIDSPDDEHMLARNM